MPDADKHRGRFVILAEPLATGAIGRAYLAGVTPARLRLQDVGQKVQAADIIDDDASALQPAEYEATALPNRPAADLTQMVQPRRVEATSGAADPLAGRPAYCCQ